MVFKEAKTSVWWNINNCPVPHGYDPRQVGTRIVSALSDYGISGPVTVTAVGRLTHGPETPDNDVLRELSSTGIALVHAQPELPSELFGWREKNPAPANIMIICGPTELEGLARTIYYFDRDGYRVILAYPQRDPAPAWLWESFLHNVDKQWLWTRLLADDMDTGSADNKQLTTRLVRQDKCSETGESPWFCSICYFAGQSFEDFSTHLQSEEHALAMLVGAPKHNSKMVDMDELKEEVEMEEVKTLVWWNISSCPVPPGYDPLQVGPRIVSALKNCGVSGPVTITAIGSLTHSPHAPDNDVLRKLSSTGIALVHTDDDSELFFWTMESPAPVNIMIIGGPTELHGLAPMIYDFTNQGHRIFLAYPQRHPAPAWLWESFLRNVEKEWLWARLLADDVDTGSADNKQLPTRLVRQDKCSETHESPWCCDICEFVGQSFEDFSTHLQSEEHARANLD